LGEIRIFRKVYIKVVLKMGYGIKEVKGNNEGITLKKVSISGNVCGNYSEISIRQVYENTSQMDIEGVYIFPIPESAKISGFEAEIGGRTLKTIVEEKDKALKIYENAKMRGENTFLLEQFGTHIFKISIGKIISGETVNIKLSYIDELQYKENTLKLVIPAVSEPKRVDEDTLITSIDREGLNKYSQESEFEFKTNILVESLCKLQFQSPYHRLKIEREVDTIAKITLDEDYDAMDKDFILLMKEEETLEGDGMVYEYKDGDEEKGIVYLRLIPKLDALQENIDENYIFLIDISSTMKGKKIEQAKNALQLCIRNLTEGDRFDIIAMGDSLKYFCNEEMAEFNSENLRRASKWIDALNTEEDADIFDAIKYSLENEGGHNTILLFTDDQVEEEEDILAYVSEHIADNRIFTFGIDSVANNYFLNKLAHECFGKAEFINKGQRIEDVVLKQFKRIQNPQVDDVVIDWGDLKVENTYPRTINYMYDREPFFIFADVLGEVSGEITISGNVVGKEYIRKINLDNFNTEENASLLKKIWARKRINSIELSMEVQRGEIKESMRRKLISLSREHRLISKETTFIFMELREEPVLGIELKNIIPIKVNEKILEDEEEIEETLEHDKVGFLYKGHEDTIKEDKYLGDTEYLDRKYTRQRLLRIIAKNQFADGSFVDYEDSNIEDKIETTAMGLLAFTMGNEDIDIYFIQLDKAIRFICNNSELYSNKLNNKLIKIIIMALNRAVEKQIAKEKTLSMAGSIVRYLYKLLYERKDAVEIIEYLRKYSFNKNLISLFNLTEDRKSISEKIVIGNEENSIFNMAKLAVLKGLKK
jgi:Ca-activated chloride channel family protein